MRPRTCFGLVAALLFALSATSQAQQAVTFDKVLEYLSVGAKEETLLKLLDNSPTTFTLDADQLAKLKAAGASDALIAKMQKSSSASVRNNDIRDFVLILDCSGSMKEAAGPGVTKWEAATKAAVQLIDALPDGRGFSFIIYGHDAQRECQAVDVVRPLSPLDRAGRAEVKAVISRLKPIGHTPITLALRKAGEQLERSDSLSKIILITDGMETCHGDPNKEAALLHAKLAKLRGGVDVVGLGLVKEEREAVSKIAEAGHGKYFDAKNVEDLERSVKEIKREIVRAEVEPEVALSAFEKALVEQLQDKDMSVREQAANTLATRKVTAAVPFLIKRLGDEQWDTYAGVCLCKEAALKALKALAPERVGEGLMTGMKSKTPAARAWAAGHEAGASVEGREFTNALCAVLLDPEMNPRAGAAKTLGKRKDTMAVPALMKRIGDDAWATYAGVCECKDAAHTALKAVAADKVEDALMVGMKSSNPNVRAWATKKLAGP